MLKKKIKDLTLEECKKICKSKHCKECPLSFGESFLCQLGKIRYDEESKNFDIEKEVEVDE